MNNWFSKLLANTNEQGRNTFRVVITMLGGMIPALPLVIYLALQSGTWQLYVVLATLVGWVILLVISAALARQNRANLAMALIMGGLCILLPALSALIAGLGLILSIAEVLAVVIVVGQTLSGPRASRALITAIVSAVLTLLIDLFAVWERVSHPLLQNSAPYIAVAVVLALGAYVLRQFREFSLRTKLISGFLLVALIPLGVTFLLNNRSTRQNLTNSANSALRSAAAATADNVDSFIADGLTEVLSAAQFHILQEYLDLSPAERPGSETETVLYQDLRAIANRDPIYITSVGLMDARGEDIADTFSADVSLDKSDRVWFTTTVEGGLPYVSPLEFSVASGQYSLYFTAPVRDTDGKIIGVLRVRYNADVLQKIIADAVENAGLQESAIDLFDENHIFLAITDAPEEINKTVAVLPADKLAQLQAERRLPEGSAESLSVNEPELEQRLNNASQQPVFTLESENEQAAVVALKNQPWVVLFAQNQDVFLAPLVAQTRASALLALLIAGVVAAVGFFVAQTLSAPIIRLTAVAEEVAGGNLSAQARVESSDEIGALASTFNHMSARLKNTLDGLEQRVADRTRNLELAAEVGRSVSQVRALDVMLKDAAELIRAQFDLYYVQVYLTDPSQTVLLMLSGTGQVGEQLVGRGHRLPLNTGSINGRAATEKKSVVIADTSASATFRPNPLLPDTRSEMAVPLIVGEKVVGVLDLQSEKANTLTQELLPAFEALAGQLAIAIQNANLLAETEQARAEVEAQARRLVRANWVDYLDAIHKPEETGFVFEQNKIMPLTQDEAVKENALVAPIAVTGETLGNLVVEMGEQASIARGDELVNTIARQVAQHIEALRLLESAERYRAEAEEASRRLTREGWKTFAENTKENLGYFYDLKEVRPHNGNGHDESAIALPLKVRDEVLGKLSIQGLDANDSQALELVNAVAERLSAHIESLRQFEQTKRGQVELDRRAQQLAAVAEISTASSKELDIQKMLESVVNLTQRKFGLYHAHVFTYNEYTDELQIAACGWQEGHEHEGTHETVSIPLSREQSLVARAARTRQSVIVNDVKSEPGFLANSLLPETASEMAVPLIIGDQVLGVLDVQSDHINAFSEEDANIQATLASQVATALQNARSFARAQQQAARESTLNIISQKIQNATSVEAVLQIAARELGHALGAPMTVAQLSMKDKS
jgi:GAF domain-containing protein/HAMP domain-containing protein